MNPAATAQRTTVSPKHLWIGAGVLGGAVWLALFNHLRVEWTVNPQYNYGWGVPLLAAYLFSRRWPDRPEPAPPQSRAAAIAGLMALGILLLPLRLFAEANPDWRLVSWASALTIANLTGLAVWFIGGARWLRHFLPPLAFLLLAVPWPSGIEMPLIDKLMESVAALTVEVLNWLGVLARQRGNLIELTSGIVGINEACSGVRSLQSTLMISIFLGELYRFPVARRLALLASGVALAFALNVGRSFFLTWMCVRSGSSSINTWHDPAGFVVFGLSFTGLLALCFWLRGKSVESADEPLRVVSHPRPPPLKFLISAAVWLLCVELGTEAWYRAHERQTRASPGWTVAWPAAAPQFKLQPVAEETRRILRYSDGGSASWADATGSEWLGFFFRWKPGRASAQLARRHTPDVCLTATGVQLVAEHGVATVSLGELQIPFRTYTFEMRKRQLYVFYCVWEDRILGGSRDLSTDPNERSSRIAAVLAGRRHLGQQVLEVAIVGPQDVNAARQQLTAELQRIIHPAPARSFAAQLPTAPAPR
ncbi:MAG TPA: exosortase/archaeosortase family protein [Verrucomicrobiae bacterium]